MSSPSSEEEKEYEVEKILEKKTSGSGTVKYLIKWKGYKKPTWEPAANCDCRDLIIAFEREHGGNTSTKKTNRKRNRSSSTETISSDDEKSKRPASTQHSVPRKNKRVVQSPKRRPPAIPSPRSTRARVSDSSESDFQIGKSAKKPRIDPSYIQGSSKTKTHKAAASPPKTPAVDTPRRSRTSGRTPVVISTSRNITRSQNRESSSSTSSYSPSLPTSSSQRSRTAAKKSPLKSPTKSRLSFKALTPMDEVADLNFTIERIESLADVSGVKKLIVIPTQGRQKTVDIKAAAKQNIDLVLDFLIARLK